MDPENVNVMVTFYEDGATAVVTLRDLKSTKGAPITKAKEVREGMKVLTYWQGSRKFLEARWPTKTWKSTIRRQPSGEKRF